MNIKCVVFDFDNTIYLEQNYYRALIYKFSELLPELEIPIEYLLQDFDERRKDTKDIFGYWLKKLALPESYRDLLVSLLFNLETDLQAFVGVDKLLARLKENQIGAFVLTNGIPAVQLHKWSQLNLSGKDRLSFIPARSLSGDKPNVETFEALRGEMKASWENVLVIGDNFDNDLAYPLANGAYGVLIRNKQDVDSYENNSLFLVENFNEINLLIPKLFSNKIEV